MEDFVSEIRKNGGSNLVHMLGKLEAHLLEKNFSIKQCAANIRHLEALGFFFESTEKYGAAAWAYELASKLDVCGSERWQINAIVARLRDLIGRRCWEKVHKLEQNLKQATASERILNAGTSALISLAWDFECRQALEDAVQCYCLAFEFCKGNQSINSKDGDCISAKIRKIRFLQMKQLAEEGLHEEAAKLHEQTRKYTRLAKVSIYEIISAQMAAATDKGVYREVLPARRMLEPKIKFLHEPVLLTSEAGSLDAPPQYYAFFKDCLAFPRSNIILQGGRMIYDLAAHPRSGIAEIRDGANPDQIMQAVFGNRRSIVEIPERTNEIENGLALFGFQSRNYGHWLLEFIPRMLNYNHYSCPSGLPICVDEGMPDTHGQIIDMIDRRNRAIIQLPPVLTHFQQLGVSSPPVFFPFDILPGERFYDTIWPHDILQTIKQEILDNSAKRSIKIQKDGCRFFISRRRFLQRQLLNEELLAQIATDFGFEIIYPEDLSFDEQVAVFNSAEIIIGSASSALTNCIFCNSECHVIALIHSNTSFNFRGYTSMIESSGAKLMFIRGNSIENSYTHPFHFNYIVNPNDLKQILTKICT